MLGGGAWSLGVWVFKVPLGDSRMSSLSLEKHPETFAVFSPIPHGRKEEGRLGPGLSTQLWAFPSYGPLTDEQMEAQQCGHTHLITTELGFQPGFSDSMFLSLGYRPQAWLIHTFIVP